MTPTEYEAAIAEYRKRVDALAYARKLAMGDGS